MKTEALKVALCDYDWGYLIAVIDKEENPTKQFKTICKEIEKQMNQQISERTNEN